MDQTEFMKQQMEATERMKRMHERSRMGGSPHIPHPTPDPVRPSAESTASKEHSDFKGGKTGGTPSPTPSPHAHAPRKSFDLSSLIKDGDAALIIGLLLLLYSERADQKLLLALLYILI